MSVTNVLFLFSFLALSSCFMTPVVDLFIESDEGIVVDGDSSDILISASVLNMGIDERRAVSYLVTPSVDDTQITLSYGSSETGSFSEGSTHAHLLSGVIGAAISEPGVITILGVAEGTGFLRIEAGGVSRHIRVKVFNQVVESSPYIAEFPATCYCHP